MSAVKVTKIKQTVNGKNYTYWMVSYYNAQGNRIRSKFSTEKQAIIEKAKLEDQFKVDAAKQEILSRRIGEEAAKLTNANLLDAAEALEILEGRTRLRDAARFFMKFNYPSGGKKRIKDLAAEYIARCENVELRPASLADLKLKLSRFAIPFADRYVHQITKEEIKDWLNSKHVLRRDKKPISDLTKKHYAFIVGGMMQYAKRNEYITINPVRPLTEKGNDVFKRKGKPMPVILPVDTVQSIMFKAQELYPELVPVLAVGFFAGVRVGELLQLDWNHINIPEARITIPPEIAKTSSVRHITMEPNLAQWLIPYIQKSGRIAPKRRQYRYRIVSLMEKVGLDRWPFSIMRHCYGSYLFARNQDAAKVASEMGHRDTKMLFDHYRGLATKEAAEQYWKIVPRAENNTLNYPKIKTA